MQFKVGKRFAKAFKAVVRFKRTPSHDTPLLEPQSPLFFDIVAQPLPVTEPASPRSRATSDSLDSNETVEGIRVAKAVGGDIGSVAGSSGEESSTYSRSTASVGTSDDCSHEVTSTDDIPESNNSAEISRTSEAEAEPRTSAVFPIPMMEDSRLPPSTDVPSSPPAVYTEPPVPNPFLEDESEVTLPEEGDSSTATPSQGFDQRRSIPPADDIPLFRAPTSPVLSANFNKAVPPPPASDGEDEDEPPELSLHGLVAPAMFLPIPNVRLLPISFHLIWWLRRF
jgi:hypothetical protein